MEKLEHDFGIIVSQDCDLTQDFTKRESEGGQGTLPNVILCPAQDFAGIIARDKLGGTKLDSAKQNQTSRLHYLRETAAKYDLLTKGLPALGIDFANHFVVPTSTLYAQLKIGVAHRRVIFRSPYFEHLSTRFCAHVTRVGLPWPHHVAGWD